MAASLLSGGAAARFSPLPLNRRSKRQPPLTISTSPSRVDATVLRDLLHCSGHSCHNFPVIGRDSRPEPVDLGKLRLALEHSAIVVSVFCRSTFLEGDCRGSGFAELFERAVPVPTPDSRLVGFGRAVTDGGLTASIHDVVVIPPLQRLGIGRRIVQKIIRFLTSRGIYDISALCSKESQKKRKNNEPSYSSALMTSRLKY